MKQIPLTQGKFAIVDDEDFEYLNQWKWTAQKKPNGFYAYRTAGKPRKRIFMHALLVSVPEGMQCDHKNLDTLDNQKKNLRIATRSQNMANRRVPYNKTGERCIQKRNSGYQVKIKKDNKWAYTKSFLTLEGAIKARNVMIELIHGEFARKHIGQERK